MNLFKNSRVYVLATVAYTGSFLFGKLGKSVSTVGYEMQHANKFPDKRI